MSSDDPSAPQPEPKKANPLLTLVLVCVGLIGVVIGVMQMKGGLSELFGVGVSAEVMELVKESDAAIDVANQHLQAADPLFQTLLKATDAQPLDELRRDHGDAGREAANHFAQAAEQFRAAAKKLDEALTHDMVEKPRAYLADKSRSYQLLATVCDNNREIIDLVLNDELEYAELEPQVLEIAARRDAAAQEAARIAEQAEAAVKQH